MSDTTPTSKQEAQNLKKEILSLVAKYQKLNWPEAENSHQPGDFVPYAGRVFDEEELVNLVDASLDFWLTTGRFARQFETEFAAYLSRRYALLCNSGSSANLLAVSALTSYRLKDRQLKPGDEVITVAAGFPTTVAPIVQNRLVPVFIDVDLPTLNADTVYLEEALSNKTRAIILAHTLGNPFDLDAVLAFAEKHNLFVIEDNCDALGSLYKGQLTGSRGDLSTSSFYPAHHITMGEGGCVTTSDPKLKVIVESFRDWGRDCYCDPGKDNTCGKRFGWQLGQLPEGYDHKYIYSHLGYNLKLTDMQAAIGLAQLKKLADFSARRRANQSNLRRLRGED
ncbi:MAG TPA: lipopolysaccharide biosynthesis protein RfbH, partial [Candidatus Obscuribacter sp.]|nr:lipopolysaccharide biosynthesis protein RfbH [Candidatus Obscuribacter sp.]